MAGNDEKIKALSEQESEKLLGKGVFRMRVKEVIDEHISSVDFMKKIREYAGMEMDSRLFISFKFWLTTIISSVIATAIGIGATLYFK